MFFMLNHEKCIERIDELMGLNVYLPLVLYRYVGMEYLDGLDDEEKQKYFTNRVELMGANDYNQYLKNDFQKWLQKYPQFKNLIKTVEDI